MAYKNNLYWRQEQDDDMRTMFTTDNNSVEWLHAYRRTYPRLRKMGQTILRRYYSKTDEDLITDAITNLLTKGIYKKDKPKTYAYCGTIIKRYFYDKLVKEKEYNYNKYVDDNYDINTDEFIINSRYYEIEINDITATERQEQLKYILNLCDTVIAERQDMINRRRREINVLSTEKVIEFMELAKDYFNENFMETEVSFRAMADYINERHSNIKSYQVYQNQLQFFGAGFDINKYESRDYKIGKNYIQNDFVPNENHSRRNKDTQYNYF